MSAVRRTLEIVIVPAIAVLISVTSGAFLAPQAVANPFNPTLGDPYFVKISNAGQKAIVAGGKWAAGAAVCVASSGTTCVISGGLIAVISPYVENATICQNNGTRELEVQNYLAPPPPGGYQSEVVYVIKSSKCINA